jgi:DNA-binding NtrC family response regulator
MTTAPKSILIADDDPAMLRLYTRIFSDKDYSITMAASFAEARGCIEMSSYDLLITDLMLMDGLGTELVKLFEKKRAGAKSLLVTGSDPSEKELAVAGVYECLDKPFNVEHFLSAVDGALGA